MSELHLRPMEPGDVEAVAELVYVSTNSWYEAHGHAPIFRGGPSVTRLYCEVYEALDPGCCVLAVEGPRQRLAGSCFYHVRPTHVALGIMNVSPDCFGRGVARRLLGFVTELAEREAKPVRLVSSAMNLDSFSLYTRAGFVPRQTYQDVALAVPETGLPAPPPGSEHVRAARPADVDAMAELELELSGIDRRRDLRYFVDNAAGIWHASVYERDGRVEGFLASVRHAATHMLGPGVTRDERQAAALIHAELDRQRGGRPVLLLPVDRPGLVRTVYEWGGRNCELHVHQVRGAFQPFRGVNLPTFMPETG